MRGVRGRVALAAALGLIAVAAGVARLAVSGDVIARVFRGEAAYGALVAPLLAVAGLIVVRGYFQYLQATHSHRTSSIVRVSLRKRLYTHSLALGPGHFDTRRTGDVILTLGDSVEALETFFGQYLPQLLVAAAAPVLIFAFVSFLDLQMGATFLAFAVFTLLVPGIFHRWNRKSSSERRDSYGAMGAEFLDSVQGLTTLKAFGQSRQRGEVLAERARRLYRSTMGVLAANQATGSVTMLGISAGAATALGVGAMRVSNGDMELRTLLIILMLGVEVFRPLRELTFLYHQGMVALSAAESVFAVLDSRVEIEDPGKRGQFSADTVPSAMRPGGGNGGSAPEIEFEGVSFGYIPGRRLAIEDLSFTLRPGERLGLVGPSGAGKSTVVWLMMRLYDPQSGMIKLGGRDIREIPLQELREQIAMVTQDTYLFYGTVADNLRFGKESATQEEMEAAARAANAHEFIAELPRGYDTVVGERAVRLSGGQRQRIAIARALLKDAPVLVLDEATSNVDAENEETIRAAIERLMAGRTTLVIAHRLSSVSRTDRIVVLDGGRKVEVGTHSDLADAGGVYARLMAGQAGGMAGDLIPDIPAMDGVKESSRTPTGQIASDPVGDTDGPGTPYGGRSNLWGRLFGLIRPWWAQQAVTFLLGIAHHGSIIGLGVVSAMLVGTVFTGGDATLLYVLLALMVVMIAIFSWAESWLAHDLAFRLLAEMRIDIYRKLDPLAPAYMVGRRSGDLLGIVGGDVEKVEYFFAHTISPAFVAVVVPTAVLATLSVVAWPLALVLLPFLAAVGISPFFAQRRSERLGERVRERLGELHAQLVDSVQGMREIVAFGRENSRTGEVTAKSREVAGSQEELLGSQAFQVSFSESVTGLGGLAVLATGAWLVLNGDMVRPDLLLATILALSTFQPVSDVARTIKELVETRAASKRVFEVHDAQATVQDGAGVPAQRAAAVASGAVTVSVEGARFAYESGLPNALDGVTFSASAGETVALVGRSGAGKTTCAYLLMRFWDPDAGRLLLDGNDLRDFKLDELRRNISLVSQETYLFNASIRENILLGKPSASEEELEATASQANASDFIESFPERYDTTVGERGMQLSGGQRQRISIARALLKDAPVLILDEATSHLDAVNEQQVREALERLKRGRTTLVIAHRLSTVRNADRIVVLDRGLVVEEGDHAELLSKGGLYAQLVSTQLVGAARGARREGENPP